MEFQHSEDAIKAAKNSSWNLDSYASDLDWAGVGIGISKHRDSDAMDRSNWDYVIEQLNERFPDETPAPWNIAHLGHWAVGWVDWLTYDTGKPDLEEFFKGIRTKLADYPLLDEDRYHDMEWADNHPDDGYCYCTPDDSCGCEGQKGECSCGLPSGYDPRT